MILCSVRACPIQRTNNFRSGFAGGWIDTNLYNSFSYVANAQQYYQARKLLICICLLFSINVPVFSPVWKQRRCEVTATLHLFTFIYKRVAFFSPVWKQRRRDVTASVYFYLETCHVFLPSFEAKTTWSYGICLLLSINVPRFSPQFGSKDDVKLRQPWRFPSLGSWSPDSPLSQKDVLPVHVQPFCRVIFSKLQSDNFFERVF